jgi:hypothetical protein
LDRAHLIEILAEFIVIFGVGTTITYVLRRDLDIISLLVVGIIGFIFLLFVEIKKGQSNN